MPRCKKKSSVISVDFEGVESGGISIDDGKYLAPGTYCLKVIATANGYNSIPANALIEIFY